MGPSYTSENQNFFRLIKLFKDEATQVLRYVVREQAISKHAKIEFSKVLDKPSVKNKLRSIRKLRGNRPQVIAGDQWLLLYPTGGKCDLDALDFTLLFVLLRNVTMMSSPATGWNAEPDPADLSTEACLVRLKLYRNQTLDHRANASVDGAEFTRLFNGTKCNILKVVTIEDPTGTLVISESSLEDIRTNTTDPDVATELKSMAEQWHLREADLNETVERIEMKVDNLSTQVLNRTRSTSIGDVNAERETSVAALGRDLKLGTTYDTRNEGCHKSTALWQTKLINENKKVKKDDNKWIFKILEGASQKDKMAALEMDTRLRVSWLTGLVEVKGSAEVLENNVESKKRANVVLQGKRVVRSETLNTKDLESEGKEGQHCIGTHVITAITFGENVFFVFECDETELSKMKDIVHRLTKPIAKEIIEILSKNWDAMNHPTCKVYDDAKIQILQSLNAITKTINSIKTSKKAPKPLFAQLCPLGNLGSIFDAERCVSYVEDSTVKKIEDTFGRLIGFEKLLCDMKSDFGNLGFSDIIGLQQFQEFINTYRSELQRKLKKDVEGIRKGDIIDQNEVDWSYLDGPTTCGFANWEDWFKKKGKMISTLQEQLRNVREVRKIQAAEMKNTLKEHKDDYLVCLKIAMESYQHDILLRRILDSTKEEYEPPCKRIKREADDEVQVIDLTKDEQEVELLEKKDEQEVELFENLLEMFTSFFHANSEGNNHIAFFICQDECQAETCCFEAEIHLYKNGKCIDPHFEPPTQPGKVTCYNKFLTSLTIQWDQPECGQKHIEKYEIRYKTNQLDEFKTYVTEEQQSNKWQLLGLEENMSYKIQVRAVCKGNLGYSIYSELSENIKTGQQMDDEDTTFKSNLTPVYKRLHQEQGGMRRYEIGPDREQTNEQPKKTILMVGESGSGKTTMINAIVNYLKGVEWTTDKRYVLIDTQPSSNQAFGQTKNIATYTMYKEEISKELEYDLTIVDTPGYGDLEGIRRDQEITDQMREFFISEGLGVVKQFDAVVFVVPETSPRLTITQNYIFNTILALFGESIKENMFIFFTFSSVNEQDSPPALAAIQEAQIPYKTFFCVNNGGLFFKSVSTSTNSSNELWQHHWKNNQTAFKNFFQSIQNTTPKSVELFKNVLEQRHQLMIYIENICAQLQTDTGLNKLEQLHEELKVIKQRRRDIDKKKSFSYEICTTKSRIRPNRPGLKSTVCLVCSWTCHSECQCTFQNNGTEICQVVNNTKGLCIKCPQKCSWSCHNRKPYMISTDRNIEEREINTLQARYLQRAGKALSAQDLEQCVQKDIDETQGRVTNLIEKAKDCVNKLSGSEQQNTITTINYIELMIAAEKESSKQGWHQRISSLEEILDRHKKMKELVHDGIDPMVNCKEEPAPYSLCTIL